MPAPQRGITARLRRLLSRVGNPLEWSDGAKCLLAASLSLPCVASYAAVAHFFSTHPSLAPHLNRQALALLRIAAVGTLPLWLLVVVAALRELRRRSPRSRWLVHATVQLFSASSSIFAFWLGLFTAAVAWVFFGAIFVGFLFFGPRPILLGIVTSVVVIVAATTGAAAAWIPFVSLLHPPPSSDGTTPLWWVGLMWLLTVPVIACYLPVVLYWQHRERQLAGAYRELSATKDRLVRAESLAAVGSLVTGAAHELRNPLGSSGALFQSLKEEIGNSRTISEEEKRDTLESIEMALQGQRRAALIAERLYSLTDSLAHVDERRPLAAVLDALGSRYPGVAFDVGPRRAMPLHEDPGPSSLPVNDRALTTILSNLLDNALAAGGEEKPTLEVHLSPSASLLPLSVNGEGAGGRGWIVFAVSDSGRGIPKEQQPEVFKPFFTGEKAGEGHGVGLGLYIVHELVSRMGGQVDLESEEGGGTRVTVRVAVEGVA